MHDLKRWLLPAMSILLLTSCGFGDACDRPQAYVHSKQGSELVVPSDLDAPDADKILRVPEISEDLPKRSNPCSAGPPQVVFEKVEPKETPEPPKTEVHSPPSTMVEDPVGTPAANPVLDNRPLEIGPGFNSDSVEDTIDAWIESWASADAPAYLSFYSKDLRTLDESGDREQWLRRRRDLLLDTGPADIAVRDVTVEELPAGRRMVRLVQDFNNSEGPQSVVKLLEMVKEGDGWRIRTERVVEIL